MSREHKKGYEKDYEESIIINIINYDLMYCL